MTKTALITGCSSGIGNTTAKLFADRGWNVIATICTPTADTDLESENNALVNRLDV
jgi:NAD(P)-dependent dehydrogenase (short-subunit alcohol dehydrogenase family)